MNVLIGESGSGKSLTARAMVQQIPNTLDMQYDCMTYEHSEMSDMHNLLGKEIGFISQNYTHSFNDHTKLGKQLISIYRQHYKTDKKVRKNCGTSTIMGRIKSFSNDVKVPFQPFWRAISSSSNC